VVSEHTTTATNSTSKIQSSTSSTPQRPKLNVSILAATDVNRIGKHDLIPNYGISVSKEVFGNITAGAYAMDNGIVGVSLGFNF